MRKVKKEIVDILDRNKEEASIESLTAIADILNGESYGRNDDLEQLSASIAQIRFVIASILIKTFDKHLVAECLYNAQFQY